jgi:DNA-binding response OmpR family regulator
VSVIAKGTARGGSRIQADSATPLKGRRVVVADRHAHTRIALRDMVMSLGASAVSHAQSAGEVLRDVRARDVDIILCDYHLEELRDGQQLLEELRHNGLIPLATIFMMITGERSYKKVVAVAEFAPDDYLVKPFTANILLNRLLRISRKKDVFSRAYTFIEGGRIEAALPECRSIAARHPEYTIEAYKLMIDLLIGSKRYDEAEDLLQIILERKAVPWAYMGLANVHYVKGRLVQAESSLEKLAAENREYLGAQDFLAKIKAELGKPEEALKLLEDAGAISSANVNRLRRTGELAVATGDHDKAGKLFSRVLDRVRNSSMARPEDFIALSNVLIAQGRIEEAGRVVADQRRTMRGAPDADLVSCLMEYRMAAHGNAEDAAQKTRVAVDAAIAAYHATQSPVADTLAFELFSICLAVARDDNAFTIGQALLSRSDISEQVRARVQKELQARGHLKARATAIVPLHQVIAMLNRLSTQGWNEALGLACHQSIEHWAAQDPEGEILATARARLADVLRKYGFDASALEVAQA